MVKSFIEAAFKTIFIAGSYAQAKTIVSLTIKKTLFVHFFTLFLIILCFFSSSEYLISFKELLRSKISLSIFKTLSFEKESDYGGVNYFSSQIKPQKYLVYDQSLQRVFQNDDSAKTEDSLRTRRSSSCHQFLTKKNK